MTSLISRNFDIDGYWGIGVVLLEMIQKNQLTWKVICPDDSANAICRFVVGKWSKVVRADLQKTLTLDNNTKITFIIMRNDTPDCEGLYTLDIEGTLTSLGITTAQKGIRVKARPHNPANESRSIRSLA